MARPFSVRQAAYRAALAATSFLLAATAAGGQGQTPNVRTVLPGFDQPILLDTLALARPISGKREEILAAVNSVLVEWKILIEEREGTAGRTEHVRAEVSRRIGGEPISKYLNCGRGFSGNNADFYRLRLAIAAWPFPLEGEPKELRIATIASGRDPAGSRSSYGACASNGKLEERLWARVVELLEAGGK